MFYNNQINKHHNVIFGAEELLLCYYDRAEEEQERVSMAYY
jgi:hypothetical protein